MRSLLLLALFTVAICGEVSQAEQDAIWAQAMAESARIKAQAPEPPKKPAPETRRTQTNSKPVKKVPELTEEERLERGIQALRNEANRAGTNVTMRMYDLITPGCGADLAFRILGTRCEELSRSEIAGIVTAYYVWHNTDGSSMSLLFQNGVVSMRSQFGLK